jgi:hypothetical protein
MAGTNRREFIGRMAGLGGAWLGKPIATLLAAHEHARQAARATPGVFKVFTPEEAADVAAMAAEIIPTDASPGATEAHVVYFIDHILSTTDKEDRPVYVEGLPILREKTKELFAQASSFASLASEDRVRVLKAIEDTHFFGTVRGMTIAGFLSDPQYHGNFGGVGWKHIGFTPAFAWQPPFGDYDADGTANK